MTPEFPLDDLEARPIPELIADPLLSDHVWLLAEMDRLIAVAEQVETTFEDHEHVPAGLSAHLSALRGGLARHIASEEQLVFPAVLAGNADEIRGAIRDLERDHETAARALLTVREMTGDLTAPSDAGEDWSDLYESLTAVEARIQRHANIEDHVLFPRVFFEQPNSPGPGQGE